MAQAKIYAFHRLRMGDVAHALLSCELLAEVFDYLAVLDLGAEKDDFGIFNNFDRVARWPIKKIGARDAFVLAVFVGDGDFALDEVAPVRRLAEVVFEPFQERRDVGPSTE